MSGVQERKEGSYASLERKSLGKLTNHDLGLTLLPRSQIRRKDEKRSGIAAASSPKQSGSKYVKISEQWNFSETEIPAQETAFPTRAKSPSSFPDPGPDLARFSHATSRINGERPLSRNSSAKSSSGVVDYNAKPLAPAPSVEQTKVTGEVRDAGSRKNDGCSPRAAKRTRMGSRASNQTQQSKVSKKHEAALEIQSNRSHMYPDQSLSETDVVPPEKPSISCETIRDPDQRTGNGLGSRKSESWRQLTHSLDTAPARFHQETSEGTALHSSSVLATLASRDQNMGSETLTEHYQPSFSSRSFPTQHGKPSRAFPESPADIGTQVLKPRKEVNRSSTRPFPNRASKIRANQPASSLASFTPGQHHSYHTNTLPTSTHLHISNSHPSHSLPITPTLSKDFNYPSNVSALESIFQTARATNQRQSLRRRSASVPNLSLTSARPNMDFSNNVGSASMPTPPRENPRSPEVSNQQQMTGASLSKTGALAASGQRYSRPLLEVKSNYSQEEVKSLVFNLDRQAKTLKAENTSLQSVNAAMKKGYESLQHEKAGLLEQIQHYERTFAHKDNVIEDVRLKGFGLLHQYKRLWLEHQQLLKKLRKEDGTGNPSAIAQKIRQNHSPSALSQGNPPSASASPLYCANRAQLSVPTHRVEQTSPYFNGHVQPMLVPSNQQLGDSGRTVTINGQIDSPPMQQVPTERVTIDLTDESQSPSSSASPDAWVHQTHHSSVHGGSPPFNPQPGQFPPAQYPAGSLLMSQNPPDISAQGEDLIAMRIQGETMARIAKKDLSWLKGENPFKKPTRPPIWGQPLQSNAEQHVLPAQTPEAGRVAPLPETATHRTKTKAPKKTKVVLDDKAKKERAKVYRRTAAEKKKREKELAKQALQNEDTPANDMRAQKQDRRAAKGEKRREQARKPSEEVGTWEPQKTLDGRLYQEDTGVQQVMYGGSRYQEASDDRDSLFDGSEGDTADSADTDIVMQDDAAVAEEQARARLAAEIEAELEADAEEDMYAGGMTGFEQGNASGGQDYIPTAVADNDHGFHDFSDESEESEEE